MGLHWHFIDLSDTSLTRASNRRAGNDIGSSEHSIDEGLSLSEVTGRPTRPATTEATILISAEALVIIQLEELGAKRISAELNGDSIQGNGRLLCSKPANHTSINLSAGTNLAVCCSGTTAEYSVRLCIVVHILHQSRCYSQDDVLLRDVLGLLG